MKLIIDIPEEVVTAIQNGEDYRYDIHTTIAQGIPYESSGDLISREALKQMMPAPIEDEYKRVHQIIDNAPSVPLPNEQIIPDIPKDYLYDTETTEFYVYRNKYTGKEIHIVKNPPSYILDKRPQGEWIGNAFDEHYCNRCGHPALWEEEPDDYYEVQSRFCPNCGADMKGGKE